MRHTDPGSGHGSEAVELGSTADAMRRLESTKVSMAVSILLTCPVVFASIAAFQSRQGEDRVGSTAAILATSVLASMSWVGTLGVFRGWNPATTQFFHGVPVAITSIALLMYVVILIFMPRC